MSEQPLTWSQRGAIVAKLTAVLGVSLGTTIFLGVLATLLLLVPMTSSSTHTVLVGQSPPDAPEELTRAIRADCVDARVSWLDERVLSVEGASLECVGAQLEAVTWVARPYVHTDPDEQPAWERQDVHAPTRLTVWLDIVSGPEAVEADALLESLPPEITATLDDGRLTAHQDAPAYLAPHLHHQVHEAVERAGWSPSPDGEVGSNFEPPDPPSMEEKLTKMLIASGGMGMLLLLTPVSMLIGVGLAWWLGLFYPSRRPHMSWPKTVGVVFGALVITLSGEWLLSLVFEVKEQSILLDIAHLQGVDMVLAAIAIVVAAPLGEELLFRRVMFRSVQFGFGTVAGLIASAATFALIHFNPAALPVYVWIALMLTLVYDFTGRISAAIMLHLGNNATAFFLLLNHGGGG